MRVNVEITFKGEVKDGRDQYGRSEKQVWCKCVQYDNAADERPCGGNLFVTGQDAIDIKEGDKGTVTMWAFIENIKRRDGSGSFEKNSVKIYEWKKEG